MYIFLKHESFKAFCHRILIFGQFSPSLFFEDKNVQKLISFKILFISFQLILHYDLHTVEKNLKELKRISIMLQNCLLRINMRKIDDFSKKRKTENLRLIKLIETVHSHGVLRWVFTNSLAKIKSFFFAHYLCHICGCQSHIDNSEDGSDCHSNGDKQEVVRQVFSESAMQKKIVFVYFF